MAKDYCEACVDLEAKSPDFIQNGVTTEIANNLADDKGFNGNTSDCEDLNDANDCLIGFMEDEVEAYDDCDWKLWAMRFARNVHSVMGAVIAAICGIWDNIHNILTRLRKVEKAQCDNTTELLKMLTGYPPAHYMTNNTEVLDWQPSDNRYFAVLSDLLEVEVCGETSKLIHRFSDTFENITGIPLTFKKVLNPGDVIASINKGNVVPDYMTENDWRNLCRRTERFLVLMAPATNCIIYTQVQGRNLSFDDTILDLTCLMRIGDYVPNQTQFTRLAPTINIREASV